MEEKEREHGKGKGMEERIFRGWAGLQEGGAGAEALIQSFGRPEGCFGGVGGSNFGVGGDFECSDFEYC